MTDHNGGLRPIPDPTLLTTQQLLREIDTVKDLLRAEVNSIATANYVRFAEIAGRFGRVEDQRIEHKRDTQLNVDAALNAQKEAANKSEANTKEQITQQYATVTAELKAITEKITDLSGRVGTIEAVKIGGQEMKSNTRLDVSAIISIALFIIALIGFFATRTI
jgi:hypothetical protein